VRLAWLEDERNGFKENPEMMKHLLPAIMLTVLMTVLTGLAYPLAMTGLAGYLFPHQANGSLIERDGKIIGSELIGQNFTSDRYFHGRPSATTDTDPNDPTKTVPAPYNADNSGGSNLGPTSKALVDRVKGDAEQLAAQNPSAKIPVDLVTTSASGLDPDITPAAALFQVPRVAKARNISEEELRRLVAENTTERLLGVLGEPHVNVLKLNLALDKAFPAPESRESKENSSAAEATPAPAAPAAAPPVASAAVPSPAPVVEPPAAPPASEEPAPAVAAAPEAPPATPPQVNPPEKPASKPQTAAVGAAAAVFPSQISPAHAGEKLDVALLKTCTDQFHANAATNSNGGLNWKAYWKECKKRLKS
jgi:potassium-transporting ATPase KdpC subunit